ALHLHVTDQNDRLTGHPDPFERSDQLPPARERETFAATVASIPFIYRSSWEKFSVAEMFKIRDRIDYKGSAWDSAALDSADPLDRLAPCLRHNTLDVVREAASIDVDKERL